MNGERGEGKKDTAELARRKEESAEGKERHGRISWNGRDKHERLSFEGK